MRNRIRLVAPLLFALAVPGTLAAITAEEIVAKNVEARGGAAALASLKSLRRTGRYVSRGAPSSSPCPRCASGPGGSGRRDLPGPHADPGVRRRERVAGPALRGPQGAVDDVRRRREAVPARGGPRRAVRGREGQGPRRGIPRDRGRGRHARAQAAREAEMGRRRDGVDRPRHVDGRFATCRR